jgi:hypothetical protein
MELKRAFAFLTLVWTLFNLCLDDEQKIEFASNLQVTQKSE